MRLLAYLLLILPFGANAQVLNGDFEMWSGSLNNSVYAASLPAQNPKWSGTTPDNWTQSGLQCRVDDAYTGNFGMLCYTFYNYVAGSISYMDYGSDRPDFLTGYYKYQLGDADYNYAIRYAQVTVWSNGDTIGTSMFKFDTVSTYSNFQSPIIYTSPQAPDSLNIYFHTNGVGSSNMVSGFLFLDDIELTSNSVGIENTNPQLEFNLYPNPIHSNLYIDYNHNSSIEYQIFNLQGKVLSKGRLMSPASSIPMDDFTPGIYLIGIKTESGESIFKIIKD